MGDHQQRLYTAWVGEIQGEAFFAALAAATSEEDMSTNWALMAELERRVGVVLAGIVNNAQSDAIETESSVSAAKQFAAAPQDQAMASIGPVIDSAVLLYNTMRDEGPTGHATELDILARHEIALQTFARRELAEEDGSMDEVVALVEELRELQGK